eukprot:5332179-Alexandrium_andersonii.AAC.2
MLAAAWSTVSSCKRPLRRTGWARDGQGGVASVLREEAIVHRDLWDRVVAWGRAHVRGLRRTPANAVRAPRRERGVGAFVALALLIGRTFLYRVRTHIGVRQLEPGGVFRPFQRAQIRALRVVPSEVTAGLRVWLVLGSLAGRSPNSKCQRVQHVGPIGLPEVDHALRGLVPDDATLGVEVRLTASLCQSRHRQKRALHSGDLELDPAPVLLVGDEAQLCLAKVGGAAAVRSEVAGPLLRGLPGDHLLAAEQPLRRDRGCSTGIDREPRLRVAIELWLRLRRALLKWQEGRLRVCLEQPGGARASGPARLPTPAVRPQTPTTRGALSRGAEVLGVLGVGVQGGVLAEVGLGVAVAVEVHELDVREVAAAVGGVLGELRRDLQQPRSEVPLR